MKLKITIDQKTYEVDVEAAEPETRRAPPRGYPIEPAPVRLSAAAPPPLAAPRRAAPVNEEKGVPQPGFGHRGAGGGAGRPEHPGGRYSAGAGSHEDGNQYHRAGRRQAGDIKVEAGDSVQSGQVVVEFE